MNLREYLTTIRDEAGSLTAATVVAAATPRDHALHSRFEWDNKIAGPAYRLVQAQQLIRSVQVVYNGKEGPTQVRAFLSVTRDTDDDAAAISAAEYRPVEDVLTDRFARDLVLRNMHREWQLFKRRYEHLSEFAGLTDNRKAG